MTRPRWQRLQWVGRAAGLTTLALTISTFGAPSPSGKHFVWRVTSAPAPFYLAGSFHTLTNDAYPLPGVYRDTFAQAQRLLFEYDPRRRDTLAIRFREASRY